MKANELRIGNYVSVSNKYMEVPDYKIDKITIHRTGYCLLGEYSHIRVDQGHVTPIPLTEEWLLKFGFTEKYKSVHSHWNYFGFGLEQKSNVDDGNNHIPTEQIFYYDFILEVKYVHQLQNLYFALTGEELTIQR